MNILETIIITISSGLIGGSISYYFSEKIEYYKFELLKKEQSAKISELFSFWIRYNDKTVKMITGNERRDYLEKLNKLTWELFIWIKDEKIVKKIMDKLTHNSREDIRQIIFEVRKEIQKEKNTTLKWEDVVSFK